MPASHVVLLVGVDEASAVEVEADPALEVERSPDLGAALVRLATGGVDAVLLAIPEDGLVAYRAVADIAPGVPVVVLHEPDREAEAAGCVAAGAEDQVQRGAPSGILPRALRYAIAQALMRRELRALETTDPLTGLPSLRGFLPVAEHHLRIADRSRRPVILLFVQLDDLDELVAELGRAEADELVSDAAAVIMEGVRDADFPARVADDTFAVLLTGEAGGAEALVLSRLVEAIATRNARSDRFRPLSLSIGSALYDPEHPASVEQIIEAARARMAEQRRAAGARADRSEAT
jgi:diguanylate cyclase (GGDEF)-like protein